MVGCADKRAGPLLLRMVLLLVFTGGVATGAAGHLSNESVEIPRADVRYLVVNNAISKGWCTMTISALLTGFKVTTLGHELPYSHTQRLEKLIDYIDAEGLSDGDVVVTFDGGDVVFTGKSPTGFIENFIRYSPASEKELDAFAIHRSRTGDGVALPPVLFSGEVNCMLQQTMEGEFCASIYDGIESMLSAADARYQSNAKGKLSGYRFLNAGGMVARVWALKVLKSTYDHFLKRKAPMAKPHWFCDQSAYGAMYFQQQRRLAEALTEISASRGSNRCLGATPISDSARLPHFTPLGLIGIDLASEVLFAPFYGKIGKEACLSEEVPDVKAASPMVELLREHPRAPTEYVYVCPRPIHELKNITDRVFPLALHFPGYSAAKAIIKKYLGYLTWYPRTDAEAEALRRLLGEATLELWAGRDKKIVSMRDVCLPFLSEIIRDGRQRRTWG